MNNSNKSISIGVFFLSFFLALLLIVISMFDNYFTERYGMIIFLILLIINGVSFLVYTINKMKEGRKYKIWILSNLVFLGLLLILSVPFLLSEWGIIMVVTFILPDFGIVLLISLIFAFFIKNK
ncbi:MAG: hypothetical protein AABX11_02015 [Nanoarchaeota archaeon]